MHITDQEGNFKQNHEHSRSTFYCAVISSCIAVLFFTGYYSPHGNAFSLRSYLDSALIISILVGVFSFIIGFSISRLTKVKRYMLNKNALQEIEFETPDRFNSESMEEKARNPQPLSGDLYYDYWKRS